MTILDGGPAVDASQHLGLAGAVAKKYRRWAKRARVPQDELWSQALFGLAKAARSFDPAKGVQFSTYAVTTIDGYVRLLLTRWKPMRQVPAGEGGEPLEAAARPEPDGAARRDLLDAIHESLPRRDAEAVILRFGLGGEDALTLDEVGQRLGVSRERVRQVVSAALRKLSQVGAVRELAEGVALPGR